MAMSAATQNSPICMLSLMIGMKSMAVPNGGQHAASARWLIGGSDRLS